MGASPPRCAQALCSALGAVGYPGGSNTHHGVGQESGALCSPRVLCSRSNAEPSRLDRLSERPRAALLPAGEAGGCRQRPAPRVSRTPVLGQLQALVWAGGAITHVVLSPAQSRNSQLELACTRLVQWYLSLLPLSDLITRKKLNLTSCRCPEGTLKNSCFSQRLLILHVRRFHSRLAINQVFAWKRPCVPDSTMSPIYSSGGFAAPSLCLRCGLGREVAAVRADGGSGGSAGRSGLQHPARHWSHTGLNLPPVLSTSRRQRSALIRTGVAKAGFDPLPFFWIFIFESSGLLVEAWAARGVLPEAACIWRWVSQQATRPHAWCSFMSLKTQKVRRKERNLENKCAFVPNMSLHGRRHQGSFQEEDLSGGGCRGASLLYECEDILIFPAGVAHFSDKS